ncbi:unnamed protein product [Colias eurytheme]|nr:unnamed protein product [Colias eurytheme]
MGWCRCRKVICVNNPDNDELQRLEHTLRLKEEELLRTDKKLQIKKKKLNELDRKALKIQEAKRKLSVISKALEKCKKYEKKPKQNKKKKNEPVDVIHNFFDKILKMDKDLKKVAKVNKYDLMRRILLRPCGGVR